MSDFAFEYAPVGLAELEDRVIRRCNDQFARTFGGSTDDFRDHPLDELYPSLADFERIGAHGLAGMRGSDRYSDDRILRRRDGTYFWCRVRGQSLTPDDPFRHSIWSFADVSEACPAIALTPREREVAIRTAIGLSAREIGTELGLSHRTVKAHRAALLNKFQARELPELVAKLSGLPV